MTTMLYGPERHEPLVGDPWSEGAARTAIERWVAAALADFDPTPGWRAHPREDGGPPGEPLAEVYGGAGGAIWALEHLAAAGAVDKRWNFRGFVPGLAAQQVAALADSEHGTVSFLIGESGLRLLEWKHGAPARWPKAWRFAKARPAMPMPCFGSLPARVTISG